MPDRVCFSSVLRASHFDKLFFLLVMACDIQQKALILVAGCRGPRPPNNVIAGWFYTAQSMRHWNRRDQRDHEKVSGHRELAERKEADADSLATVDEKVEAPSHPVERCSNRETTRAIEYQSPVASG